MNQDYLNFMSSIYGPDEVDRYTRVFDLADRFEVDQYKQQFEEIIAHSDVIDPNMLHDEWHSACINLVRIILKGLGIFTTVDSELPFLLELAETLQDIEYREDRANIEYILNDTDLDNKEKLIQSLTYFSTIDEFELSTNIENVHNGIIKALAKVSLENEDLFEDIEIKVKLPPLIKNVRLLINEDPNFIILEHIKAGLALGLPYQNYLNMFWEKIIKQSPENVLRELSAIMLISDTPPHEMLSELRKIIGAQFTDLKMIKYMNEIVVAKFAPILIQKSGV